ARRKPAKVPIMALTTVAPVVATFDRRTVSVASTTQNACSMPLILASSTDSASATPARTLLRNQTARGNRCGPSTRWTWRNVSGDHIGQRTHGPAAGCAKSRSIGAQLPTGRHRSRQPPDLAKIIAPGQRRRLVAGRTDRTDPRRGVRRDRAVDRRLGIVDA